MSRFEKIILGILATGIIVLAYLYGPYGPLAQQMKGIALAQKHIQAHADLVRAMGADPRYSEVEVFTGTWDDGGIELYGEVAKEEDEQKLIQMWEVTNPPVRIYSKIRIIPEPYFTESKKREPVAEPNNALK